MSEEFPTDKRIINDDVDEIDDVDDDEPSDIIITSDDTEYKIERATEIVDKLRFYAWSRGLPFLTSPESANNIMIFI